MQVLYVVSPDTKFCLSLLFREKEKRKLTEGVLKQVSATFSLYCLIELHPSESK